MMLFKANSSKNLYRVGAVAAFLAALIFRRNLGVEIAMLTGQSSPDTAAGWFTLLQSNSLLGLGFLNIFDLVDYALVGIMLLAVYLALRPVNKRYMDVATLFGVAGIVIYFASNTAFSMLSLSSQYSSASTDAQKSSLLSAGQAVLAMGDPGAVYQGVGGYVSLLLLAAAGLIISAIMLRSNIFNRATAYVGIVVSVLDLTYLAGVGLIPPADAYLLSAFCVATAGLLLLVWHLLIGLKLHQLSKTPHIKGGVNL